MSATTGLLDYGALLTGIGGGLALFLYGMRKMTESLKVAAGGGHQMLQVYRFGLDNLENLKRLYSLIRRIAHATLDARSSPKPQASHNQQTEAAPLCSAQAEQSRE